MFVCERTCTLTSTQVWTLLVHVSIITVKIVKNCTKAMVFPVVMYGCESWTVKKAEHRRIDAFELWCCEDS